RNMDMDYESKSDNSIILEKINKDEILQFIAELGSSNISVADFLSLSLGEVIELNANINAPMVVKIGNKPKFLGQAETKNKRMAVQILEEIKEGNEEDGW